MNEGVESLRELRARDEIGRVIVLYGQLLDDHRFADWGELFTDDATWRSPDVTLEGRSAIVDGLRAMQGPRPGRVKHVSFTPVLDLETEITARAWTDFIVLHCADENWGVVSAGRYHDVLVYDDDRWRFDRREAEVRWPPDRDPLTGIAPTPGS